MIYHNDNIPSLWGIFVAKLRYTRKHVSWCYSWMLVRYSSIKRCKANSVDLPRPGWMVGCAVLRPEFHPWSSHKTQMQPWRKTSRHITNPHACWKTNRKNSSPEAQRLWAPGFQAWWDLSRMSGQVWPGLHGHYLEQGIHGLPRCG